MQNKKESKEMDAQNEVSAESKWREALASLNLDSNISS